MIWGAMKSHFVLPGLLAALLALAGGCGDDDGGGSQPKPDASAGDSGIGGTSGSGGVSGSAGLDGGGPECQLPEDCPPAANECSTPTCDAGVCGAELAEAGTIVLQQTAGDCKLSQCDGAGNLEDVIDDTDLPDDDNECTIDACDQGVPSNTNTSEGTACGAGKVLQCNGQGQCVGCSSPSDCAGQDDDCKTRTCSAAGVCGADYAPQGKLLTAQTAGDCKQHVCDGTGNVTSVPLSSDLPVDGNPCTDDICTQSTPSNPPLQAGTACSGSGGTVCNGSGSCVACVIPGHCPGQDSECQSRTCNGNTCGVSNTAAGTQTSDQTAGDCKRNQCDGAGSSQSVSDDTDLPDDGNPCTADQCTNGTPSNPPLAEGSSCGGNLVCNATGSCVGCNSASECPGTDNECRTKTCTGGACGFSYVPNGTPAGTQATGDCKQNQCDGAGSIVSANLPSDVPVDNLQCTSDVCTNGTPSNPPLASGAPCTQDGGSMCDGNGACVQCLVASDCGTNSDCASYACTNAICSVSFTSAGTPTSNQVSGDCKQDQCDGAGNVVSAVLDSDLPDDNKQCTADLCTNGTPSNPDLGAGTTCSESGGNKCNGAGSCVQCLAAGDCGTSTECKTFACSGGGSCSSTNTASGTALAAQTAGDCQKSVCDGNGGTTTVADDSDLPVDNKQCTADLCTNGVPSNPNLAAGTPCTGGKCDGAGSCVACITDSDCGTNTECAAYTCTANACVTTYAPAGTALAVQTPGDCKHAHCDGNGNVQLANDNLDLPVDGNQCTDDVCTSGTPSNPASAAGTSCTQDGGKRCDGTGVCVECLTGSDCLSGVCVDQLCVAASCADGVKNGSETDVDCGGSCAGCDPGKQCAVGSDCETGICTGGVCMSPNVVSVLPADGATGVAVTTDLSITFTNAISAASLTTQSVPGACSGAIQLSSDNFASCVGLTGLLLSAGDTVATLTPTPALSYATTYKLKVTTAVTDAFQNPLGAEYVSATGFTTVLPSVCGAVVISQVYGGGGNAGATYTHDFIELHNRSLTTVSLEGWSVQYASNTGSSWSKTDLSGSIAPGGYYLIRQAFGGAVGAALPTENASGSINLAGTAGKVALVSNVTTLTGTCPTGGAIVDFVGYGTTANCFEGSGPTSNLSNTNAAIRKNAGCTDTDDNAADFSVETPTPRNSDSPAVECPCTANESDAGYEADFCNLQSPTSLSIAAGASTGEVYGRIYEAGVTEAAGAPAGVVAQVGWGPATVNPTTQSGWQFFPATYNIQLGNDDEYVGSFSAPATPGSYRYTYRFSVGGASWTYCDLDGAGSNGGLSFDVGQLGVLTVN
jgi:hypothetical protein